MIESVQEEKATLALQLLEMTRKPPESIINGSVNVTRQWLTDAKKSRQTMNKRGSSVNELKTALVTMRAYL